MNTITHAFKAAGVPLPSQMQRIWTWLKDHQPQTAKHVAAALHLSQASTLLSQLERRRMVTSTKELDRSSGMMSRRYSTVGRTYELLPLPKKVVKKAAAPAAPAPRPTAQVIEMIVPCPVPAPQFDLDALTIAEARALYSRLARMFKGEAA